MPKLPFQYENGMYSFQWTDKHGLPRGFQMFERGLEPNSVNKTNHFLLHLNSGNDKQKITALGYLSHNGAETAINALMKYAPKNHITQCELGRFKKNKSVCGFLLNFINNTQR